MGGRGSYKLQGALQVKWAGMGAERWWDGSTMWKLRWNPHIAPYIPRDKGLPDKVDVQNDASHNGEGRHVRCFVGRKFIGPSGSMQFAPRVLIQ